MAQKKIVGYGHSHLSCLQKAYGVGQRAGEFDHLHAFFARLNAKSFQPNFEYVETAELRSVATRDQGKPSRMSRLASRVLKQGQYHSFGVGERARVLTEALERRMNHILRREDPDAVLLAAMGNEYNTLALLRHPQPYDFDMPGSGIETDTSVEVIPYKMMKAQMQQLAEQNVLLFWRFFNGATDKPIFMVPPPPPISSEMHILSYPGNFGGRAKKYGVSPVGFRRKMWLLYCEVLRETVTGTNTQFVDLPEVVFVDGCLAKQFWQEDPTHGNVDYGRLLLDHVATLAFGSE